MPCRGEDDYRPQPGDYKVRQQDIRYVSDPNLSITIDNLTKKLESYALMIDKLTIFLCTQCDHSDNIHPDVFDWWDQHQYLDKLRKEREENGK